MIKDIATDVVLDLMAHVDGEYLQRDAIANNQYSAADIYIYVTYRWASRLGLDLSPYSGLKKMIAAIQTRPAVLKALEEQNQPLI